VTRRPGAPAGAVMSTRQAAWDWGTARLRGRSLSPAEARVEAGLLLRHACALSREELLIRPWESLPDGAAATYATLIEQRMAGRPTAYLVGRREFFGLEMLVDERVLIPRPETECLVEAVRAALEKTPTPLIVDIGTGSGAIAIALARTLPEARVVATDPSAGALAVARLNADRHGVADRIAWAQGDDLSPLAGRGLEGRVDALVCNPPYVPSADLADLPEEVRAHEPREALDGGPDGLAVHRRVIGGAPPYLHSGALLALEVAGVRGQSRAVAGLIVAAGAFRPPRIIRDYAGIERIVIATRDTRPPGSSGGAAAQGKNDGSYPD
jgi:release factor glutamine methyltransferase